ncbi:MAG: hypothetical protein ACEQSR_05665 [Candidatus Methylacidiphilales bacterium]
MNRNFVTGIVITAILTVVFLFIFYFSKINTKSIHAINVLPENTVFAVEVSNINLQYKLLNQQVFWQQLTNNKIVGEANNNLKFLDSLLNFEENFKEWKNDGNMVVSFHAYTNKTVDAMVMIETKKKFDIIDISNWIYQTNKSRLMVSKRKFASNLIYDFIDFKTQKKFSIAYKNKIFAVSSNGQLIEEALLNIANEKAYEISQLDKLSYVKSLGTYSLYVNYKNMPTFLSAFVDLTKVKALNNIPFMANWSAFGVNTANNNIQLNGVTISDEINFQYFDCFNNMQPQEQSFKKLLPQNTSYFLGMNYNDDKLFDQNLKEYNTVNKIENNKLYCDSINKIKLNSNLYNYLTETFGNEVVQVNFSNPQFSFDSCEVLAIKIKDKNKLASNLSNIAVLDSVGIDTLLQHIPNLYKVNLGTYFNYTWGNLFLNVNANYALIYNDFVLFCNNGLVLNEFYKNQLTGNLLSKNAEYQSHLTELSANSNLEFFVNNNCLTQQAETFVNQELLEAYKNNIGYFKKARFLSMQMSATKDKNYLTNVHISFNTNANKNTELLWELSLDTTINTKPQIVFNSATKQNAILVQDLNNQLYFINNESKILFKIPIAGKIISEITQVDAFNNGKTQYLFNTNSQIYLIDETGKNLQGYPLWIPTGTDYAVKVFDYLNDKSYQIFTIGRYYKIWCYNIQGKLQTGWNPKNHYPNPIQNMQGFVFRNDLITYNINQKGKLNFYQFNGKLYNAFGFDSNMTYKYITHHFVDTNFIKFYYIDSTNQFKVKEYYTQLPAKNSIINSIKTTPFNNVLVNNNMCFMVKNGTQVNLFNHTGGTLFTKNLLDTFNHQFDIIYKSGAIQVSYLDSIKGKLFLEKTNNKIEDNFPLKANYYYSFGHLLNDENYFVITANFDNKLFVYQIK